MKTVIIGVYPGKAGFFTAFDGKEFQFYPMPEKKIETGKLLKSGKPQMKSVFDDHGLINVVAQIKMFYPTGTTFKVFIEEVGGRGGWSATNNFNFGYTAGLQKMVLLFLDPEPTMVRPQKWQSFMRQGYNTIKKASSTGKTMVNDSKAQALAIVENEYPQIDFRKTERSKVPDDNKIDSFLICLYGYRTTAIG